MLLWSIGATSDPHRISMELSSERTIIFWCSLGTTTRQWLAGVEVPNVSGRRAGAIDDAWSKLRGDALTESRMGLSDHLMRA
jgi:hypothetical protein